jgi:peptidoglycan L-alanyl-D-glutamate endopeptidase CwlK
MDCDVDIARFTEVPYVVERPAGSDDFADRVTDMLSKAGLRMEFASAAATARAGEALVTGSLPKGIGFIGRDGRISNADGAETLVSGTSRPPRGTERPDVGMAMGGWTMLGHALSGPDRASASSFAALMATQAGAPSAVITAHFAGNQDSSASRAWNSAMRMPVHVVDCRERLEKTTGFSTASSAALAKMATALSSSALEREIMSLAPRAEQMMSGVRGRILEAYGSALTVKSEAWRLSSFLGDRLSGPSLWTDEAQDQPLVEAKPFDEKHFGPSYLPLSKFNAESLRVVQGIHPDLLKVVARASEISKQPFQVVPKTGGVRSAAVQDQLKHKGASRAKLGRHTIGYAIDLVPVNGRGNVDFSNLAGFDDIMVAMKQASEELSIPIDWGGNWKKLVDKPHFELNRKVYPGPGETAKPEEVLVAFR